MKRASSGNQPSIRKFFKKQESGSTPCSKCHINVDNKKLKWHEDYDCVKQKPQRPKIKTEKSKTRKGRKKPKLAQQNLSGDVQIVTLDSDGEETCNDEVNSHPSNPRSQTPVLFNISNSDVIEDNSNDSNKKFIANILEDWKTPNKTPGINCTSRLSVSSPESKATSSGIGSLNKENCLDNNDSSEDDFAKEAISFRTPDSQRRRLSLKRTPKSIKNSDTKSNVDEHYDSDRASNSSRTNNAWSSCKESGLVSPTRTPTPTPEKSDVKTKTIDRLQVKANLNIKLSPSLYNSPNRHGLNNNLNTESSNKRGTISVKRNLYSMSPKFKRSPAKQGSPLKLDSTNSNSPSKFRKVKGMYLDNFNLVLDTITSQPQDIGLFDDEDLKILRDFHELSLEARKLYVRLIQRKKRWLRCSTIEYKEICEKEEIILYINELIYANFLDSGLCFIFYQYLCNLLTFTYIILIF